MKETKDEATGGEEGTWYEVSLGSYTRYKLQSDMYSERGIGIAWRFKGGRESLR